MLKNLLKFWKSIKKSSESNFNLESYFDEIYHGNLFRGVVSKSGAGSELDQTQSIRTQIPLVLAQFNVKSICDLPCGDFNWMEHVNLGDVEYTGYDIAESLIADLNLKHGTSKFNFKKLNIVKEIPEACDLVLCRDLLVHLNQEDALEALSNIIKSGSMYLLTTTFPEHHENINLIYSVDAIGWYPINLQSHPFNLGNPILLINENCTEGNGEFTDKSLALYKIN
jgi:2-polyprenyl-3-methyl-5-hydroxy-6-metoxy-1,4-benzoquinol methylase